MVNKRFSLFEAYSFGFKAVLNHFVFFMGTMCVGAVASLLFLAFLGVIDYWLFSEHFNSLMSMFSQALHNPTGAVHSAGHTVHDHLRNVLPSALSKHVAPADSVSIDVSGQDVKDILVSLLPAALVFKFFVDTIAVGWTKMALDLQANKQVSMDYIYKYYYYVPRVFVVGLVVGLVTLVGFVFFILPGVYIYQRLRFARYFVIDKNQSIVDSLQSSWNITDGVVLHLVGYSMVESLVQGLGNTIVFVSMFIAPLGYQVEANVYRQMVK